MVGVRVFLLAASCAVAVASPVGQQATFIGKGTEKLATALLKVHAPQDENLVFSPLGLNTLLAIFAEGARSESRDEIAAALSFPQDTQELRRGYQTLLRSLSAKFNDNIPEMKNWFYAYKNNSLNEELKEILQEYYLTEIKVVERPEEYLGHQTKVKVPAGLQGKPTDHLIDVDKEVEGIIQASSGNPHKTDGEEAHSNQQPALFDHTKNDPEKVQELPKEDVKPDIAAQEVSKEEIKPDEATSPDEPNHGSVNNDAKPQLSQEEVSKADKDKLEKEASDGSVNEVKKKEEEMMVAMQRSSQEPEADVISGMTDSAVKSSKKERQSQLVVFNGFYYKGDWETQLMKLPADDSRPFYKSNDEKVYVQTLQGHGVFGVADCPDLKSKAIELKYVGGRYSLLVVVPHARDGLNQLASDISDYPISKVYDKLSEKLVDVCLPTFEITTISKPVSASKGDFLNINKIFNPETADLSGISQEQGLFVEELVQLVTFKVDSNYTEANFLTASIASTRSDATDSFRVNQPFLFYLRDNTDGVIVVNGKVTNPTPQNDGFTSQSLRTTVHKVVR